ncbi:hypothetical protein F511_15478 [Dorcoceras hygrometricum]|uniref:Uncharacterized protein n=1 Tax=Dorcoceras hygrometricum TaxID=472368 RepID=A0A2Z7B7E7_9LAMI|nr:hypothetical protein F511_15478 [Dorcoceras hygrometricum]
MGNKDPNKTKAGNKYEVKPQYEELSKQINMQHAINQCYECMRAAKEISQLAQCINRKNISGRLYTTANQSGNHRFLNQVTATHGQATRFLLVQFTQQGLPGMLKSVTGTQNLSSTLLHNHANPTARIILQSYTSTQALTTKNRAQTTRNAHPKAQKKQRQNLHNETSNSRTRRAYGISQLVSPSFQTSINGKSKSQGVQRHQERQKQRLESTGNGDRKRR